MTPPGKSTMRFLWLMHTLLLLALLLPGVLGHPYPQPVRPFVQWGGLALWVVAGLGLLAVASRRRPSSAVGMAEGRGSSSP